MREIKFRAWDWEKMSRLFDMWDLVYEGFPKICYQNEERDSLKFNLEIMQYTWIKDKNGKEVYEGDLVIYGNNQWVIEYRPWCFYIKYLYEWLEKTWWLWYGENLEILGNIYENPELVTNV